jgi:hypothetical protein
VFSSPDPHQLAATAGIQWSANERLDLSLVTLGVSPKFSIW